MSDKKSGYFNGDQYRLLLLVILYLIQGIPIGFFEITMPIMLNKNYTLTQIGVISLCSMPFRVKFLIAPIVDTLYWNKLGKRRTWIVPTQILGGIFIFLLAINFESIVSNYSEVVVMLSFGLIFICFAIQDIAVDGWAVTIVKEENLNYASTSQNVGIMAGVFLSTTVYFAFNSVNFCNSYIRPFYVNPEELHDTEGPYSTPMVNEIEFMFGWGIIAILVALYTLLFHSEKDDRVKPQSEQKGSIIGTYKIAFKLLFNRNMFTLTSFWILLRIFSRFSIPSSLYLLKELEYDQGSYSIMTGICLPIQILFSILL